MNTVMQTSSHSQALATVSRRLEQVLSSLGTMQEVLDQAGVAKGKLLRPALVALTTELCEGALAQPLVDVATGVELIHVASLVHDDIIDNADIRRGQPTVSAKFGSDVAVLAGDFLFATAFALFTQHQQPGVLAVMTETIRSMCEGEVGQLLASRHDEAFYWRYIRGKTASLLGASCRVGAILAQAPSEATERLEAFGLNLGYAFQLTDDLLDYTGNPKETGKGLGADFMKEVPTLPLIRGLERGLLPANYRQVYTLSALTDVFRQSGIIDEVRREAQMFVDASIGLLDDFPPSAARDRLQEMAMLVVARRK